MEYQPTTGALSRVPAALAAAALVACILPARRAETIDAVVAMRAE